MRCWLLFVLACGASQPVETLEGEPDPAEPRLSPAGYQSHRPAARVRWEMNEESELLAGGWHRHGVGTSTFAEGILTTTGGYEEWMQRDDRGPSDWWRTIDNERGWAIDARVRVVRAHPECGSLGFWIHDGARMLKVWLRDGSFGVDRPGATAAVDTNQWHEYRIEGRVDWIRLIVDGETVFEERSERMNTGPWGGTQTLMFGDLGGCNGSEAEWDWFAYDTGPRLDDVACDYCGPTESFRIAQLRQRMSNARNVQAPTRRAPNTHHANEVCLVHVALDHVAREITPLLPANDYSYMREAMRQAPHVRDAASAGELVRYVRQAMERSGKPARMMRPPPTRRAPDWVNPLVQAGEMLQGRVYDPAWRSISEIAISGLQASAEAQQASANLLSALANAAREECHP